jgi:thioredoxin reductase
MRPGRLGTLPLGTSLPSVFAAGDIRHGSSSASPGDIPVP